MHLRHQIVALAIVPLVIAIALVTIFITRQSASLMQTSIDMFETAMLESKEAEIVNLTSLALSAIQPVYGAAAADDADAQEQVMEILRGLDYGKDGYFFVYDYDGNGIVHPRQGFRPGRNWMDLTDPDGNKVIAGLIETAKAGGGFYRYKWQRPSTGRVADKVSYVVSLPKWRWIVGTGGYLDEVFAHSAAAKADLRTNIEWTFLIVALVAVPATLLVFTTCMLITLRERRMADGKLKILTQRVIDAQEEERARLARELHDGISQNLLGVRYAMDLAGRKVKAGQDGAAGAIETGVEALTGAIKEVRRLSHDLRPRLLDDLGLVAALAALCSNFSERTGIETTFDGSSIADDLRPEASTALYRIAQEALNNVERHSGARRVEVRIWSEGGRARMTVGDDGRGFDSAGAADRGGLGLRNMQERMAHYRGILLIASGPHGTTLTAMMPRSANAGPRAAAA